jgi:transposase-like protein
MKEMNLMTDLERLIGNEAEHAELHRDDPIPAGAHATRRNRPKSAMLSLRLNPDELAAVHDLAGEHGVPASALVRGWIVQRLADERNAPTDTAAVVERLESDLRTLRRLVAS